MLSNKEISHLFNLYAELLLLHRTDERLSRVLSSAAYRLRRFSDEVLDMPKKQLSTQFRPEMVRLLEQLKASGTINALDELIQLTPPGLFEMMRLEGLGGKKLSIIWNTAKIDTVEQLLVAAKKGQLRHIAGFGAKTEANIIAAIEAFHANKERFHYADVADTA